MMFFSSSANKNYDRALKEFSRQEKRTESAWKSLDSATKKYNTVILEIERLERKSSSAWFRGNVEANIASAESKLPALEHSYERALGEFQTQFSNYESCAERLHNAAIALEEADPTIIQRCARVIGVAGNVLGVLDAACGLAQQDPRAVLGLGSSLYALFRG